MWVVITFALFAFAVCIVALVRGAAMGDTHDLLSIRDQGHDQHRDAA